MKFTPGVVVGAASGSIGGATASHGKGGAYFRKRAIPTNPKTVFQQEQRTNIGTASALWSNTLTADERESWVTFAQNFPITDRLGQTLTLSGQGACTKINSRLLAAGLAVITQAPLNQDVTDLLTVEAVFNIGAGASSLTFTPAPLAATDHLIVRATPALPAGVTFVKNKLRTIARTGAAEASPYDFHADWTARFGADPIVGSKVVFEVNALSSVTGAYDAVLRAECLVIDTA